MPDLAKSLSRELLKTYDRNTYSCFVQLMTGHNFLNRHNSLVAGCEAEEDGLCRLCLEDEETSFHIFAECPALGIRRQALFGSGVLSDLQGWKPWKVMAFFQDMDVNLLHDLPFEQQRQDDDDENSELDEPTGVG